METLPLNAGVNAAAAEAQWRNGLLGQTADETADEIQTEGGDSVVDAGFAAALLASLPQAPATTDGPWLTSVWADMPSAEELAGLMAAGEVPAVSADASVVPAETPAANGETPVLTAGLPLDQMVWLPTAAPLEAAADQAISPKLESSSRRGREGLRLYAEAFPEGWETLLEEPPQTQPGARTVAAATSVETKAQVAAAEIPDLAAPEPAAGERVQSAAQPARTQAAATAPVPTAATPAANPGSSANSEIYSAGTAESHRTAASVESEVPYSPESVEPASGWKTTVTAVGTGRTAAQEPLSGPAQVLQRFSEMEKQLTIQEFSRAAASGLRRGEERISVDLHPPELGRVRVVVESRGEQVNAQLTLQDAGVGEFFQDRLDTIRRQLTDAGVKLGQLTVEVRQQFAGHSTGTTGGRQEAEAEMPDKSSPQKQTAAASRAAALTPGQKVNVVI